MQKVYPCDASFGASSDIEARECFYIERQLSEQFDIPVFHGDQHGTAIISSVALCNVAPPAPSAPE